MSDDIHEVYAVAYASHARKRAENWVVRLDVEPKV